MVFTDKNHIQNTAYVYKMNKFRLKENAEN